ncbi:MAG: hypothetical protein OXB97_08575 [Rhodospirillales bacterium]|nr:hypothetical protein [Rhodospirillales bacterium]
MTVRRETAAQAQRRFADENAAIVDRLEADGFVEVAAFYREAARLHAEQADRLDRDGAGKA